MNIAIIGAGLIGSKRAKSVGNLGTIKYIVDINKKKGEKLANEYHARYLPRYEEAINDSNVDIVIISTINNLLATIAIEAIKKHKHVLVEKPACINEQQLSELCAVAEKNNVSVKVGFNHRYHPAFLKINEIIAAHKDILGGIIFIRAHYGHGGRLDYEHEWRFNRTMSGGGELIDQGVHLIDLVLNFLPTCGLDHSYICNYFWKTELEDNGFLFLKDDLGRVAQLHVSCTQWKNEFRFDIFFKNALLSVQGLGGSYGTEKLIYYQMKPEMGKPQSQEYTFEGEDESWRLELLELIASIKEHRKPHGNLNDLKPVLGIIFGAYKHANRGETIHYHSSL